MPNQSGAFKLAVLVAVMPWPGPLSAIFLTWQDGPKQSEKDSTPKAKKVGEASTLMVGVALQAP